jgi:hypothetical protein
VLRKRKHLIPVTLLAEIQHRTLVVQTSYIVEIPLYKKIIRNSFFTRIGSGSSESVGYLLRYTSAVIYNKYKRGQIYLHKFSMPKVNSVIAFSVRMRSTKL